MQSSHSRIPYLWQMLRRASPGDVRRFLTYIARFERRRHELLPKPHWFLEALAVDPQRQHSDWARCWCATGSPALTPTTSPPTSNDTEGNVVLYSKLGFELVEYVVDYPP